MYTQDEKRRLRQRLEHVEVNSTEAVRLAVETVETDVDDWPNSETYRLALHLSKNADLYHQTLRTLTSTDDVDTAADYLADIVWTKHDTARNGNENSVPQKWRALLANVDDLNMVEWVVLVEHFAA